jgi:hypothetical protein
MPRVPLVLAGLALILTAALHAQPEGGKPAVIETKLAELPVPASFFGPEVSFADQYGPFVIAGRNGDPKDSRVVYDLRDGKEVAALKGKIDFLEKPCALSPDAKLYACGGGFRKAPSVTVVELASGKVSEIKTDKKADHLEFIGPGRLLAVNNFENLFAVYDAATGKELANFKTGRRQGPPAVSPDGKTVAVAEEDFTKKTLQLYDLQTGKKGEAIPLPEAKPFGYGCEALAYSADGKQIAGLFKGAAKPTILCWSDGKLVAEYPVSDPFKNVFFSGPKLQWSPDGQGWLVNGELAVDRETGKTIWKADPAFAGPCRMVAFNQAVGRVEKGQNRKIAPAGVTKEQLAGMLKVARGGGTAADALLPKLTEADLASAKTVHPPLGGAPLTYKPDPAGDGSKLAVRPIALACAGKEIESLRFSHAGAGRVVVELKGPEPGPFQPATKAAALERYDLVTGRKLGRFDLKFPVRLAGVSPDGKQVLLVEAEQAGRLDLWDFEGDAPKHVAGWRPYSTWREEKDRKITFAAVAGPGRVLTANAAGRLVSWSLPGCKAEWIADVPNLTGLRLTPGGKYLAGLDRELVRLFDAATGESAGDLSVPKGFPAGRRESKAVAFQADGKEAAALFTVLPADGSGLFWVAARWDLAGDRPLESVPFRTFVGGNPPALEYAGAKHLLIDNTALLDLGRKDVVWTYRLSTFDGKHAAGAPDGRHWYAVAEFGQPVATLVATPLPEEAVEKYVRLVQGKDAIVKPGMSVEVRTELKGEQANRVEETARNNAQKTLKLAGFETGSQGKLVLTLSATERDTGERAEFRKMFPKFGDSPFARTEVKLMEVACQATLTLDGKPVWRSGPEKHGMRTIGIVTLPKGEKDVGNFLRSRMWDNVAAWAGRAVPPGYIAQTNDGLLALPGSTPLGSGGPETQAPKVHPGK